MELIYQVGKGNLTRAQTQESGGPQIASADASGAGDGMAWRGPPQMRSSASGGEGADLASSRSVVRPEEGRSLGPGVAYYASGGASDSLSSRKGGQRYASRHHRLDGQRFQGGGSRSDFGGTLERRRRARQGAFT